MSQSLAPQNDEQKKVARIDWSKAPDGVTHYQPKRQDPGAPDMWCAVFWRLEGGIGVEAWQVSDDDGSLLHFPQPTWMSENHELLIARKP